MKEFAGINLSGIATNDLEYLNLIKHRFYSQYKLHVCDPSNAEYSAENVILHIYNCIHTNLSIPINSDDRVASLIRNLPKEKYIGMIGDAGIIAKFKQALQYQGINDTNLQTVEYSERIKAIAKIRDEITINKSWINTAETISHNNSMLNLEIARSILGKIISLDAEPTLADNQVIRAYTIGLQIAFYTEIYNFIAHRLNPYKEKLQWERFDAYEQKMLKILYICQKNIEISINKLRSLPDDLFSGNHASKPKCIISVFRRMLNIPTPAPEERQVVNSSIMRKL